ncbi:MAG: DUF2207 domain-containing protein [Saprospiraceae bacterium]|nr:DUF2207 domain-containing protein [Saprospiraceae bacterium]
MPKRLLLLLLPVWILIVPARAEYFTITHYAVKISFTPEGYADFEELIEVQFTEPRHGIFRFIPLRSEVDGKTLDRIVRDIEVEGFDFSRSKEGNNLVLKIGDPDVYVDGRQVYRIRYRVLNPLNYFKDNAEFYWDLLGTSWPVPVDALSFQVVFPDDRIALDTEDVRCFTGLGGSRAQDAEFQVSSRRISGSSTRPFNPQEGLTLAIRLPKTAFPEMSGWNYFSEQHSLLLVPLFFLFSGLMALFFARNQRQTIMTEYFPPEGLSPAIAGGFVDHRVDSNDVLCLIPHLANHGYLRLEMEKGGWLSKDKVTFFKLKEAGPELMSFEKEFFEALFSSGDRVELSDLVNKFHVHLSSVRASVKSWIRAQGWYEPDQKLLGILTAIAGIVALVWGIMVIEDTLDGLALIGTGIILFFLAGKFNKRTPTGNQTYRKLAGFRLFIKKAERPVIERLMQDDPLYYDKTMPYALAFGYLARWNKHFEGLLSQPPAWYSGYGGGNTHQSWSSFTESFPDQVDNIGSVFSSSPSSNGGSSSGGSSGGGSGGGGGGSW